MIIARREGGFEYYSALLAAVRILHPALLRSGSCCPLPKKADSQMAGCQQHVSTHTRSADLGGGLGGCGAVGRGEKVWAEIQSNRLEKLVNLGLLQPTAVVNVYNLKIALQYAHTRG